MNLHFPTLDENQMRMDAAIIALMLMGFLFTGFYPILFIILYDYLVRVYVTPWFSPVYMFTAYLIHILPLRQHVGDEVSKRFAANIAVAVLLFTLAAEFTQHEMLAQGLTLFLLVWKVLEATKNICFGCKLFALLERNNIEIVPLP